MKYLLLVGALPVLSCVADRDAAGVATSELEASAPPIVITVEGALRGDRAGDVVVFRGIPYAQAPVGALRFRPPQPIRPWADTRDARRFGPPCPQRGENDASEDCLALNVWAPASGGRQPVMVFFHGGGFTTGSSDMKLYDGSQLVRTGAVVVVTVNYRLGALGYLATEALARESGDGAAGNYGLRDQIAALQWVHRNIAAFGGDPDMVTMFGESAGGISVCALLGSALADGLYRRAIIESGACHGFEALRESRDRPSIIERGEALASAVGCGRFDPPSCLRDPRITWQRLVEAQGTSELHRTLLESLEFAPAIDGVVLREDPIARLGRGDVAVPILIGSNLDEARAFTLLAGRPVDTIYTWASFNDHVRAIFGPEDGGRVIAIYPRAGYPGLSGPNRAYLDLVTDYAMACPTISVGEVTARRSPTYIYSFDHALNGVLGSLGATHAVELFFVFGNLPALYQPTPDDLVVAADVQRAWTTFARDGAPLLAPAWPRHDTAEPRFAVLDAPATISAEIRGGRCRQLRDIGLVP
jgi:para-nitrobenzyl esterase